MSNTALSRRGGKVGAHHLVPSTDDTLHVEVGGEERDDTIRDRLAELDEDGAKVAHDGGVVSNFESGRDLNLVGSSRDDLRITRSVATVRMNVITYEGKETLSTQRHDITLRDSRLESQHLRVHVEGG